MREKSNQSKKEFNKTKHRDSWKQVDICACASLVNCHSLLICRRQFYPTIVGTVSLCARQKRQIERLQERADRMSRLKEVAVGDYTEEDVRSALEKITEVR